MTSATAAAVVARLAGRGERVAVAESSAGGRLSAALVAVPGASAAYAGGVVVYTRDGAGRLLGAAGPLPDDVRSASEGFAQHLARGVATQLGADWGVGETGATGPAGNRYGDPAGHAWLAVAGPGGEARTEHVLTGVADRSANMDAFVARALRLLLEALA